MAVKNLYRDVLAKTSPKHRRLPMPKGMTRACGVKVRPDPSGDLAKYLSGSNFSGAGKWDGSFIICPMKGTTKVLEGIM